MPQPMNLSKAVNIDFACLATSKEFDKVLCLESKPHLQYTVDYYHKLVKTNFAPTAITMFPFNL